MERSKATRAILAALDGLKLKDALTILKDVKRQIAPPKKLARICSFCGEEARTKKDGFTGDPVCSACYTSMD